MYAALTPGPLGLGLNEAIESLVLMDSHEAQARLAMYKNSSRDPNGWKKWYVLALIGVPLVTALIWVWMIVTW